MCTDITFRLFARDTSNTLILHPDGPCDTKTETYVILTPCPPGFKLNINRCMCEEGLLQQKVIKCDANTLLFERLENSWISPKWDSQNYIGFVYHPHCPPGYCKPESEVIYFTFSPNVSDPLCSSNRTGFLCGACREDYSLTLNSFNCRVCDNS